MNRNLLAVLAVLLWLPREALAQTVTTEGSAAVEAAAATNESGQAEPNESAADELEAAANPAETGTETEETAETEETEAEEQAEETADADAPLSQQEVQSVRELLDANEVVLFGFSVGIRYRVSNERVLQDVTISPVDGTLHGTELDPVDTVVSIVLGAFPLKTKKLKYWYERVGFLANINLANFGPNDGADLSIFNKSVDGGIGLAYLLGDGDFAIAATYERASVRVPRQNTVLGEPLDITDATGTTTRLSTVSLDDNRFFQDQASSGLSLKFVYFL